MLGCNRCGRRNEFFFFFFFSFLGLKSKDLYKPYDFVASYDHKKSNKRFEPGYKVFEPGYVYFYQLDCM